MTSNSPLPTLTLLLLLSLSLATPSSASSPPLRPFTKLYAFGDSYTDTGNNVFATGPYGMTFFHRPMNRLSDGRLVIDFVAEALSLPFLPPYKAGPIPGSDGVNFAVAGSTAIEHDFFVKNHFTSDGTQECLGTQLGWFNNVVGKQGSLNDALIWVGEIGGNDYGYTASSSTSQTLVQGLAIRRVSSFLEAILKKGAKYVIVQGLPPTGCLTLAMLLDPSHERDEFGCVRSQNQLSYNHNVLLQAKIQDLRKRFPRSLIVYADYFNAYLEIRKNMPKYGLKEPFKACCGTGSEYNYNPFLVCGSTAVARPCSNPSEYISWDGVHPTEAMNKAISGLLLQGGYSHPSFQYLLSKKKSQK